MCPFLATHLSRSRSLYLVVKDLLKSSSQNLLSTSSVITSTNPVLLLFTLVGVLPVLLPPVLHPHSWLPRKIPSHSLCCLCRPCGRCSPRLPQHRKATHLPRVVGTGEAVLASLWEGASHRDTQTLEGAGAKESTLQQETECLCSALYLIFSLFYFV